MSNYSINANNTASIFEFLESNTEVAPVNQPYTNNIHKKVPFYMAKLANPAYIKAHPLNLELLSKCKVNDFERFEQLLFSEEERKDPNRFFKFVCIEDDTSTDISGFGILVPFCIPRTNIEFQINHFVLWGVCGLTGYHTMKPRHFFTYNNGEAALKPLHACFACEQGFNYDTDDNNFNCERCPLWQIPSYYGYMCEDGPGPHYYMDWSFDCNVDYLTREELDDRNKECVELAEKLQHMEWRDDDFIMNEYFYQCLKEELEKQKQ